MSSFSLLARMCLPTEEKSMKITLSEMKHVNKRMKREWKKTCWKDVEDVARVCYSTWYKRVAKGEDEWEAAMRVADETKQRKRT